KTASSLLVAAIATRVPCYFFFRFGAFVRGWPSPLFRSVPERSCTTRATDSRTASRAAVIVKLPETAAGLIVRCFAIAIPASRPVNRSRPFPRGSVGGEERFDGVDCSRRDGVAHVGSKSRRAPASSELYACPCARARRAPRLFSRAREERPWRHSRSRRPSSRARSAGASR